MNSRLRHWLSDEDGARRRALERVADVVARLERQGVHAEGRIGDADPLLAIADALPTFPADEILIAAEPEDRPTSPRRLVSPRAPGASPLPTVRVEESFPSRPEAALPTNSKGRVMTTFTGIEKSRTVRRARLAASAVAAAAAVAVAGMAAPGNAATFKAPKLDDGVLQIEGTSASEKIALRLKSGDLGTLQVDVGDDGSAEFEFARADIARIELDARPGDDLVRIDEVNGVFTTTIPTTLDGAEGDDTLFGGTGAETMRGGPGDDTIDGNRGNDLAFMGSGKDTFIWDPGDGSDTIEGQSGRDTMLFNGANASETVDLSANGPRLRFFREPKRSRWTPIASSGSSSRRLAAPTS